jgi:hypothetical protein
MADMTHLNEMMMWRRKKRKSGGKTYLRGEVRRS